MKSSRLAIALAAIFSIALLITPRASFAADGAEAVDTAWQKAFLANDLDAIVACYATDAVAWFPESPQAKGADAIRASYKEILANNTVTAAKLIDPQYTTVGDRSVAWGTFSITLTPKDGSAAIILTGRFTEVAEKRDGKWVYIVDHVSADPTAGDKK